MKLRIGKISYWHVHAWDYTKQAENHPDTEIVAVWDEHIDRGQAAATRLGVPYYESLEQLLASDIDAVIVDAPTSMHHDVMIAAARAGKHIFTEKVLAATLQEANAIVQSAADNNVKLTISLPRLNDGYTLAIQKLLNEGLLGQITQVRVRLSHNGAIANWLPEHFYSLEHCCGGALIDLGCHPMYLTRQFLGEEIVQVSAQFGYVTGREVEDNAVALLATASGSIGIVEAGFVNAHSPFAIEVHGTEGTVMYSDNEQKLLLRSNRSSNLAASEWEPVELADHHISAFEQWVKHIQEDTIAEHNIQAALELTRLMEAANRSVLGQRAVRLNELMG